MFLGALKFGCILFAVIVPHPTGSRVVKGRTELCGCNVDIVGDLMNLDTFFAELSILLHTMDCVVHSRPRIDLAPNHDKFIKYLQPGVMLYCNIVSDEVSVALVVQIVSIDSFLHPGGFEVSLGKHDVIKHLIENFWLLVDNVALKFLLDVLEHWLDRVPVCISCFKNREILGM